MLEQQVGNFVFLEVTTMLSVLTDDDFRFQQRM